jgi:hypothetical protein
LLITFLTPCYAGRLLSEKGIKIHKMLAFDTEAGNEIKNNPNYYADIAIMVIGKT